MIVFERNNIELELHPDLKILEVRWIGVLAEEDLKVIIYTIVELANKYSVESILLDATYVETSKSTAIYEARVQLYFQQKLAMPSVKKVARVSSGHVFYDETISQHYSSLIKFNLSSIDFRTFSHHYEAMDWLTRE
ncbi:MAG: hypothetical protein M3Q05_11660 [Bacteroidota bacterium]|nr:hypothetical protein [Bacteroidota bacterium]